jgi:hypothetical protein
MRFGVVGCGAISTLYQLPALGRSSDATLVAAVDVDAGHAAAVARRFGATESFTDHRALVGRVDAALVATPNTTHADIACDLLAQGVHVLCEKPLATSVPTSTGCRGGDAAADPWPTVSDSARTWTPAGVIASGVLGERLTCRRRSEPYDAGPSAPTSAAPRSLRRWRAVDSASTWSAWRSGWWGSARRRRVRRQRRGRLGGRIRRGARLRFLGSTGSFGASFSRVMIDLQCGKVCGRRRRCTSRPGSRCSAIGAPVVWRVQELILQDANMYDQQLAHFVEAAGAPVRCSARRCAPASTVERCCKMAEASWGHS